MFIQRKFIYRDNLIEPRYKHLKHLKIYITGGYKGWVKGVQLWLINNVGTRLYGYT